MESWVRGDVYFGLPHVVIRIGLMDLHPMRGAKPLGSCSPPEIAAELFSRILKHRPELMGGFVEAYRYDLGYHAFEVSIVHESLPKVHPGEMAQTWPLIPLRSSGNSDGPSPLAGAASSFDEYQRVIGQVKQSLIQGDYSVEAVPHHEQREKMLAELKSTGNIEKIREMTAKVNLAEKMIEGITRARKAVRAADDVLLTTDQLRKIGLCEEAMQMLQTKEGPQVPSWIADTNIDPTSRNGELLRRETSRLRAENDKKYFGFLEQQALGKLPDVPDSPFAEPVKPEDPVEVAEVAEPVTIE
jgi:hypothetical protein